MLHTGNDLDDLMSSPVRTLVASAPETLLALSGGLTLSANTLHVWCFKLQGAPDLVGRCRSSLSPEERYRADRFRFERDQIRFTIAHAVLRHLLGLYCDEPADSLCFDAARAGKPSLRNHRLHFNLTHSEDRALLGVSLRHELGVDLERVRSNVEALSISRHYFFGTEQAEIEAATSLERDSIFFRYWVAKEAVLKAKGIGLGFPLDRFRVDFLSDGQKARVESFDPDALEQNWMVHLLPCEPGWLAAAAARGTDWVVKLEEAPNRQL
jgi:4'-phosphopantetheinyl transferase